MPLVVEDDAGNGGIKVVHNCTIFLCSLDVRNIIDEGHSCRIGIMCPKGTGFLFSAETVGQFLDPTGPCRPTP